MFYGEYPHILDVKNRIVIPSKFRKALGDAFIITRSWDKSLAVYTMDAWRALEDKIKDLPKAEKSVRDYIRIVFGGACECEPDSQGRVLIPAHLRAYADINKEVISIGVLGHIEIWSKEGFEARERTTVTDDLAADIRPFGI